jgi:DNA-binding beta-propeller fold protein YncE
MKKQILLLITMCFALLLNAQVIPSQITLPNGWKLSPVGKSFALGDLPLNIAVSKSGNLLAVTNNGQSTQSIQLIDAKSENVIDSVAIGKSFYGLQFSADEKYLFASGGHDNIIIKYAIKDKHLFNTDTFKLGKPWPTAIGPSGIALDEKRNLLYVVTREDRQLYIFDLKTKQFVKKLSIDGEAYACIMNPNNNELYVSCWGCDQVNTLDLTTLSWKPSIKVGDNPNEMLVTPDGKYLYVCNSNDNSVSVLNLIKLEL